MLPLALRRWHGDELNPTVEDNGNDTAPDDDEAKITRYVTRIMLNELARVGPSNI